jgi:hypothetical protein
VNSFAILLISSRSTVLCELRVPDIDSISELSC